MDHLCEFCAYIQSLYWRNSRGWCCSEDVGISVNRKFTTIWLTALTGDLVMHILILEGKTPNGSIEVGIDITVKPIGCPSDPNVIEMNSGLSKYFPGDPTCTFRGGKATAVIRWHKSTSITSDILTEVFETMDHCQLLSRTDNDKSFVLAHHLSLKFHYYLHHHTCTCHVWIKLWCTLQPKASSLEHKSPFLSIKTSQASLMTSPASTIASIAWLCISIKFA